MIVIYYVYVLTGPQAMFWRGISDLSHNNFILIHLKYELKSVDFLTQELKSIDNLLSYVDIFSYESVSTVRRGKKEKIIRDWFPELLSPLFPLNRIKLSFYSEILEET